MFSTLTGDGDAAVLCESEIRTEPPRAATSSPMFALYPVALVPVKTVRNLRSSSYRPDSACSLDSTWPDLTNIDRIATGAVRLRVLGRRLPRVREGTQRHS
jgi:hypothetical protein